MREFILAIVPVILGDGARLFDKTRGPVEIDAREVKQYDNGLIQLVHDRMKGGTQTA
jgi:hypothetical protein